MRNTTLFLSAICIALLYGCQTYTPVTIGILNGNGMPISGASVHASPLYFFNPTNEDYFFIGAGDILEPFTAQGDYGVTNEKGMAIIQIVDQNPLQLQIYASGHQPWSGTLSLTTNNEINLKNDSNDSSLNVTAR